MSNVTGSIGGKHLWSSAMRRVTVAGEAVWGPICLCPHCLHKLGEPGEKEKGGRGESFRLSHSVSLPHRVGMLTGGQRGLSVPVGHRVQLSWHRRESRISHYFQIISLWTILLRFFVSIAFVCREYNLMCHVHLFPTLCSVTSHWWLGIGHGEKVYTVEMGKC